MIDEKVHGRCNGTSLCEHRFSFSVLDLQSLLLRAREECVYSSVLVFEGDMCLLFVISRRCTTISTTHTHTRHMCHLTERQAQ